MFQEVKVKNMKHACKLLQIKKRKKKKKRNMVLGGNNCGLASSVILILQYFILKYGEYESWGSEWNEIVPLSNVCITIIPTSDGVGYEGEWQYLRAQAGPWELADFWRRWRLLRIAIAVELHQRHCSLCPCLYRRVGLNHSPEFKCFSCPVPL